MADILPLGDPRLRRVSTPVTGDERELSRHLADLAAALASFRSGHGWGRAIAMPQLGVNLRIIALDLGDGPRFVLNPAITWRSEALYEVWDDCMCLPEIAVRVRRHRSVTLQAVDERMRPFRMEQVPEDIAELVQHEVDHLDGILMTDRMLPEWGVIARAAREIAEPLGGP